MHKSNRISSLQRLAVVWLAAGLLLSSGCGTVANLRPPSESIAGDPVKRTYGGVRQSCENIRNKDKAKFPVATVAVCLLDLPLTAVGDTITLPYTLAYDYQLFGWQCGLGGRCGLEAQDYPIAEDRLVKSGVEATGQK